MAGNSVSLERNHLTPLLILITVYQGASLLEETLGLRLIFFRLIFFRLAQHRS